MSIVSLGLFALVLLGQPDAVLAAGAGAEQGPSLTARLWRFLGVFHPLIVHFPVALLTLAAIVELMRLRYREISPHITVICLIIAALGGIGAVAVGWARAETYSDSDLLFNHRWLGVGLAVFTIVLAAVSVASLRKPQAAALRWIQTGGVFAAAGLVGLVGHLGAELTHGQAFVGNAWAAALNPPKPLVRPINVPAIEIPLASTKTAQPTSPPAATNPPLAGDEPAAPEPGGTPQPDAPAAPLQLSGGVPAPQVAAPPAVVAKPRLVDFQNEVWPILDKHCIECHGPNKQKAKLRLDTEAYALAWEDEGRKLWVKGNTAESYLLKVIGPDVHEDDRMPPIDTNKVVSPQEYELLHRWIQEGAVWPTLPEAPPASASAS